MANPRKKVVARKSTKPKKSLGKKVGSRPRKAITKRNKALKDALREF